MAKILTLKPEDERSLHPEALKWFNARRTEIQFEVLLEELSDDDLNTFLSDEEKCEFVKYMNEVTNGLVTCVNIKNKASPNPLVNASTGLTVLTFEVNSLTTMHSIKLLLKKAYAQKKEEQRKQEESLKQRAAAKADFNNKLSQPGEKNNAATMKESEVLDESLEPIRATDQTNRSYELTQLLPAEDQVELGEPQWEVEILPPVDITKIMRVVAYLDQLPEVENTEIIPRIDRPSIMVFLRESMNFVDVLGTIPEVAYVEEVTTGEDAANSEPRKVRIGLSGNATPQEKK